ncbi:NUP-domain-containing protein [Penicillium tannophilum]|nr:NUP-domain-containing protein [Penicillium tannophilum]
MLIGSLAAAGYQPAPLSPKILFINAFESETDVFVSDSQLGLLAQNITVPGISPQYPNVTCSSSSEVCQVTTGEGGFQAATTLAALINSATFNLSNTYFMIAGIAGINPDFGTTVCLSIPFASFCTADAFIGLCCLQPIRHSSDSQYEFDYRQIPDKFSTGFVPFGTLAPGEYPTFIYGSDVFELNDNLRTRVVNVAKTAELVDDASAQEYRSRYDSAPANQSPNVIQCDGGTSNVWYFGSLMADTFANYTSIITNRTAKLCTTANEDIGTIQALMRGAIAGLVDFRRVIVMRSASNFDRPPRHNLLVTGRKIIDDILQNWDKVYKFGITPDNYVADILNSIPGPIKPEIGAPAYYVNPVSTD